VEGFIDVAVAGRWGERCFLLDDGRGYEVDGGDSYMDGRDGRRPEFVYRPKEEVL
jgi:hypothetical protein